MSFQPVIPFGGLSGWRFLQSTLPRQTEAFDNSTPIRNAAEYFAEHIGSVASPADLVKDRRLLEVALGAYGLSQDIDNKYFIETILSEGTQAEDALSNKLADKRYKAFAQAFAFDAVPKTNDPAFIAEVIDLYERRSFEVAVGEQNEGFRIGLTLERELPKLAAGEQSETAKWFGVLGNPALRAAFETAFALPAQFGQIDIEQQAEIFRENAERRFGTSELSAFSDPEKLDELVQLYFLQEQIKQTSSFGAANIALTLLQSAPVLYE